MTLPRERTNSIINVRNFLLKLCEPKVKLTKKELRHEVRYLLKHYPSEFDLDRISECDKCSDILGKK